MIWLLSIFPEIEVTEFEDGMVDDTLLFFWMPVRCFRFGGGVKGNFPPPPEVVFPFVPNMELTGGVVGGVDLELDLKGVAAAGGDRANPGDGGGIEHEDPNEDAEDSTFGVNGVGGAPPPP